jgi:chromate reductase, NAD(P)H dehydrogenase (quinone)
MVTHAGVRLLTVCGSLQARSSNRAALEVAAAVARSGGATIDDFDRLGRIPPFDPDRDGAPNAVLADWRDRLAAADAVLVAAPEYAGGVAGVVKNAFDWVVGAGSMYRKPIAVISAGTSGGHHARQTLIQTLTWQGGWVLGDLGIAAPRTKADAAGRITDPATLAAIGDLTELLLAAPATPAEALAARADEVVRSWGIDPVHVAPA